jgi:hypothetical protein
VNVTEKLTNPGKFSSSNRESAILSLSGGSRNSMLFLRSPGNRTGAEEDNRARDRTSVIGITGLVSITISLEIKRTSLKMKTNIKGTFKILQDSFDSNNMRMHGIMHKLASLVHREGNIRPCEREILQGVNDAAILLRMRVGLSIIFKQMMMRKTRSITRFGML